MGKCRSKKEVLDKVALKRSQKIQFTRKRAHSLEKLYVSGAASLLIADARWKYASGPSYGYIWVACHGIATIASAIVYFAYEVNLSSIVPSMALGYILSSFLGSPTYVKELSLVGTTVMLALVLWLLCLAKKTKDPEPLTKNDQDGSPPASAHTSPTLGGCIAQR